MFRRGDTLESRKGGDCHMKNHEYKDKYGWDIVLGFFVAAGVIVAMTNVILKVIE